jgi:hypothetical protein
VFHADGPKEGYIRPANYYCKDGTSTALFSYKTLFLIAILHSISFIWGSWENIASNIKIEKAKGCTKRFDPPGGRHHKSTPDSINLTLGCCYCHARPQIKHPALFVFGC